MRVRECERVYQGVRVCARVCESVSECARVWERAGVCQGVAECERVCQGVRECVCVQVNIAHQPEERGHAFQGSGPRAHGWEAFRSGMPPLPEREFFLDNLLVRIH